MNPPPLPLCPVGAAAADPLHSPRISHLALHDGKVSADMSHTGNVTAGPAVCINPWTCPFKFGERKKKKSVRAQKGERQSEGSQLHEPLWTDQWPESKRVQLMCTY